MSDEIDVAADDLVFPGESAAVLLELLGLPADSRDVELIVATVADLVRQAGEVSPSASQVAAAAERDGLALLDREALAVLRRDAAEGRELRAAAARAEVERVVDDAVARGKITASRRQHWVTLIEADSGMAEVLAAVPDETAVPLSEIGHSVADEDLVRPGVWLY